MVSEASTIHLLVMGIGRPLRRNGVGLLGEVDLTGCRKILVNDVVGVWRDLSEQDTLTSRERGVSLDMAASSLL